MKIFNLASKTVVLMLMAVLTANPLSAQGSMFAGGSVTVGMRETVRNAGVDGNFSIELYYTPDGSRPTAKDRMERGPALVYEGNHLNPKVNRRSPNDEQGRWWGVVNWQVMNAGEVKTEQVHCAAASMPYSEELGGYLIDLTSMPVGRHFIGVTVEHMGGENVMQIVVFVFRSKRKIVDQAGFWLTLRDPNRRFYIEELTGTYGVEGVEDTAGHKSVEKAGNQPNILLMPTHPQPGAEYSDNPQMDSQLAKVVLNCYEDDHLLEPSLEPGQFRLKAVDGSYQTPLATTTNGQATFYVPPGRYSISTPETGEWEISRGFEAQFDADLQNVQTILIERRN